MFRINQEVLFALLQAGLWEEDVKLLPYGEMNFTSILEMAEAQGVVGLVAAGLEHVTDMKPPKKDELPFIGRVMLMEQRNLAMNHFIGVIVEKMREAGIYTLLVKGQGVAQCYERPLWRPSGDVDFLLDIENYRKAAEFMASLASVKKAEGQYSKHIGFSIDPWYVEVHGTLRTGLSTRVDRMVDAVQAELFRSGKVRMWKNDATEVNLPAPDHDVFLVFTHFIKHLYKGGVSLRQVCDWCRLLWTYRSVLNVAQQERWLLQAGLMDEWKVFAGLAVEYLGMPEEVMPLLDSKVQVSGPKMRQKAAHLMSFILAGDRKHKVRDTFALARIFPRNTLKFLPSIFLNLNWLKVKERVMGRE